MLQRPTDKWGLGLNASRVPQTQEIQIHLSFHRRRTTRLEVAIRQPFIEKTPPPPPVNIIHQALTAQSFMQANPDATPFSAASKLNLHRKRITRLLKIVDSLPFQYTEKLKNCNDSAILRRLKVKPLYKIACLDASKREQALKTLITPANAR